MKKFLTLFMFIALATEAQELDTLALDSAQIDSLIKEPPKHLIGAYFFIGTDQSPNPDGTGNMRTVGVGIKYNKFEIGYTASGFQGIYRRRLIFPNFFNLIYAHGGVYASYDLLTTKYVAAAPFASFQSGDMIWERADTNEDFLRETFSLWQIGVNIESPYLRFVRPGLKIGYQSLTNLQLSGLTKSDFSGIFIGFNVKVGYFNQ